MTLKYCMPSVKSVKKSMKILKSEILLCQVLNYIFSVSSVNVVHVIYSCYQGCYKEQNHL